MYMRWGVYITNTMAWTTKACWQHIQVRYRQAKEAKIVDKIHSNALPSVLDVSAVSIADNYLVTMSTSAYPSTLFLSPYCIFHVTVPY